MHQVVTSRHSLIPFLRDIVPVVTRKAAGDRSFGYPDSLLQWKIRSTFTFEARDGRFRITQTNLERFNDQGGGWGPIGKWKFSGWKKTEDAFAGSAVVVAQCVMQPANRDDW